MYASSFGLPFPEEITLLTLGFLAHMYLFPELFPSQGNLVSGVNPHWAAWLAYVAVVSSDFLVFMLGRTIGPKITSNPRVAKVLTPDRMQKVEKWTSRYGAWAGGIFRFTPGIRFPGHLSCGMLKVPVYKFLLVDGFAALISVPTQVYLVAYYGREIIQAIKTYQPWVIGAVVLIILFALRNEILSFFSRKKQTA
jgi:membrane protein DedA with SNARE-associated domain